MAVPGYLSLLWPTAEETELLRACLWDGARGRDAWNRWQRTAGDVSATIRANTSGIKSLLPLLHRGVSRTGAEMDGPVRAALAAAAVTESLRWTSYGGACGRAFAALADRSVPFLVVGGAALAVAAYPEPTLRHSHDIDVLVAPAAVATAAEALAAAGFTRSLGPTQDGLQLRDPSGLPVELHTRPYRHRYYAHDPRGLWARAVRCEIGGVGAQTLSAADHLLHVCGRASCCASRDGLKWVADAWYVMENGPGVDWDAFLRAGDESRLMLPVAAMLRGLARQLDAPVPEPVLERACASAAAAARTARDVALSGVRSGRRGTLRNLLRAARTASERGDLLHWALIPSVQAVRLGEPVRSPALLPLYYVKRPLAWAGRRLGSWLP